MLKCLKLFVTLAVQLILLLFLNACSNPKIQTQPDIAPSQPRLTPASAIMSDGYILPMKIWQSAVEPDAVVLALHGFNDYSNAFDAAANIFAGDLITTYAIDQRGFGATEQNGVWAGRSIMQSDLIATVDLLCDKHPGIPLFLLGESMGGAVILSATQQLEQTCIQGVILLAPAVWGWQVMPWWQTMPLRLLAHTMPEVTVTGEGLDIHPSDNDEMLRALGRDPLVIKETRIDAIYGLTDLMEAALVNGAALRMPALILYGEHDEIIPPPSFCMMLENLPDRDTSQWRLVLYSNGYHMLSRDLQAEVVIKDMVVWIHDQRSSLPSGQEVVRGASRLSVFSECEHLLN
ncbi:MAG: alpha/beta hydrolase [Proteobacteria bacterium]|nr:alpha/beta hydrolase [Pseudomonadota bacterium]